MRAGRGLRPTAAALALRPRVHALVGDAQALLDPGGAAGPAGLNRSFTVLAPGDLVTAFGARLLALVGRQAPGVRLRLLGEGRGAGEEAELRDGLADVAIVVNARKEPGLRSTGLVRDPLVGVVRAPAPWPAQNVGPADFTSREHIQVSRSGRLGSALDTLLAEHGVRRTVACSAPDYVSALHLVAGSDRVTVAPASLVAAVGGPLDLHAFALPCPLKPLRVSLLWHPRSEGDRAQEWLRGCLRELASTAREPALRSVQ